MKPLTNLASLTNYIVFTTGASLSQPSESRDAQVTLSPYLRKKLGLLDPSLILSDLERFTCRCKGGYCLATHDAAMVGQVRSHVAKLGSQSAVSPRFLF